MQKQKTRRADRRKFHYIYETICMKSHKFYIGMHSTDNLKDGYQGSGKRLWRSFRKHGKENHITKILEFLPDRQSLKAREKELINEELLGNQKFMNLALGGEGGLLHNLTTEHQKAANKAGVKKQKWLRKNNQEWAKKDSIIKRNVTKQAIREGKIKLSFTGKKHTKAAKQKMSQSKKGKVTGKNNSQYGTCWIYHLELKQSKKIKQEELNIYLNQGWFKGRKIKF